MSRLKSYKQELDRSKMERSLNTTYPGSPTSNLDASFTSQVTIIQQLRSTQAELERELVVLRNNNKEDLKLRMIKLEQEYEDCKSEN